MKINEQLKRGYALLFQVYGPQHWWPGNSPWEICAGAVLTQNTAWQNVEKAIANLKSASILSPEATLAATDEQLAAMIHPSGFFRLKTIRLKNVAAWWQANVRNNQPYGFTDSSAVRTSLLQVNGIGPETADSILLYSFNLPFFVIDAYTRRIAARHFGINGSLTYGELQKLFTTALPADPTLYNEYHALLVLNAKTACRKDRCHDHCPLQALFTPAKKEEK